MEDLEVRFTTEVGTISSSPFDEIRSWVAVAVEGNENLQVTEESLKSAKETLASYRKLKTSLEDERKRIKREWNKPYEDWEVQYKDAISSLDETILDIAGKVKAIEDEQEAKRITSINDMILKDANDIKTGMAEVLKGNTVLWHKVCKPNYYNKSGSLIKNQEAWRTAILGISRDLEVIETNPDREMLYQSYMNCGELSIALQEVDETKKNIERINQQRKAAEERKRLEAEVSSSNVDIVDIEPEILELRVPNENAVDPADLKQAKALRWIVGPKWKIKVLFKAAASLGLKVYDPKQEK